MVVLVTALARQGRRHAATLMQHSNSGGAITHGSLLPQFTWSSIAGAAGGSAFATWQAMPPPGQNASTPAFGPGPGSGGGGGTPAFGPGPGSGGGGGTPAFGPGPGSGGGGGTPAFGPGPGSGGGGGTPAFGPGPGSGGGGGTPAFGPGPGSGGGGGTPAFGPGPGSGGGGGTPAFGGGGSASAPAFGSSSALGAGYVAASAPAFGGGAAASAPAFGGGGGGNSTSNGHSASYNAWQRRIQAANARSGGGAAASAPAFGGGAAASAPAFGNPPGYGGGGGATMQQPAQTGQQMTDAQKLQKAYLDSYNAWKAGQRKPSASILGRSRTTAAAYPSGPPPGPPPQLNNRGGMAVQAVMIAKFNFSDVCVIEADNNTNVLPGSNDTYAQSFKAGNFDKMASMYGGQLTKNKSALNHYPVVVTFVHQLCKLIKETPGITPVPAVGMYFPQNKAQMALCAGADPYLQEMSMLAVAPRTFGNTRDSSARLYLFNYNTSTVQWELNLNFAGTGGQGYFEFDNWSMAAAQFDYEVYKLLAVYRGYPLPNPTEAARGDFIKSIDAEVGYTGMKMTIDDPSVFSNFYSQFIQKVHTYVTNKNKTVQYEQLKQNIDQLIQHMTSAPDYTWPLFLEFINDHPQRPDPSRQNLRITWDIFKNIYDGIRQIFGDELSPNERSEDIKKFGFLLIKLKLGGVQI